MSICLLIVTTFDSHLASYYSINSNNNNNNIININEKKHTSTMHDNIQLRSRSNSTRNGCR